MGKETKQFDGIIESINPNGEEYNGYEINNDSVSTYYDYTEYDIKKPFVLSGGLSAQFNNSTLMADFDYTDWSQLEYGDNIGMEMENINIRRYFIYLSPSLYSSFYCFLNCSPNFSFYLSFHCSLNSSFNFSSSFSHLFNSSSV